MSWNYRIVRKKVGEGEAFGVYETYYSKTNKVEAIGETPAEPYGETLQELENDLRHFTSAMERPVLDYDTLKEVV